MIPYKSAFVPGATIVLFGPGYLGHELINYVSNIDCTLHVVARTLNKAAQLKDANLSAASIQDIDIIHHVLQQASHVVTTVPPAELGDPVLLACADQFRTAAPPWVAYVSSTSVYGDAKGELVDEQTPTNPVSETAKCRLAAETSWRELQLPCLNIFRLSGLYGPERSAFETIRKKGIPKQDTKIVNRIHVQDAAGCIAHAARATKEAPQSGTHVYNVSDDMPASRADVFQFASALLLAAGEKYSINSETDEQSSNRDFNRVSKRVSNQKMKYQLGYVPIYPTYRHGLSQIASNQALFGTPVNQE